MTDITLSSGFSRREFLKVGALAAGGLAFRPWRQTRRLADTADAPLLGRVNEGKVSLRATPDITAPEIGALYEDALVPWLHEVVGYNPYRPNQRFVETPEGYIWSPVLQPVRDEPQEPVSELYETSLGPGMWVQVSAPFVDVLLENSAAYAPSVKHRVNELGVLPRLYYSQVIWVDQISTDSEGRVWYRLNERYGYGDVFWGRAEAFRRITPEEVAPITPEIEDKYIEVNLHRQTVSCFEEGREVFYCRASTGQDGPDTATPVGENHRVWRKMLSAHMSGGTTGGGWDLVGVGFTTLFIGNGIAFHSTFWHNNYGEKTSRGCVNLRPDDAKFIWRWTRPAIGYDPGDITVTDYSGTNIRVVEI
ncbi:MAG: L,D-transpeptidase [Chloroflexi bacterium]|nr:L,D-transpeptidase [Chloroflexota bacterium]